MKASWSFSGRALMTLEVRVQAPASVGLIRAVLEESYVNGRVNLRLPLNTIVLIDEAVDQPPSGRTGGSIVPVHDLQRILPATPIEQLQMRKPAGIEIGAHHRLGHAAPPHAGEQEGVF